MDNLKVVLTGVFGPRSKNSLDVLANDDLDGKDFLCRKGQDVWVSSISCLAAISQPRICR